MSLRCINDPKRTYEGDEPSPKGNGYCAHAEPEGKIQIGKDKKIWQVKNGRWIKLKCYQTHDNGGRPFLVVVLKNRRVQVYKYKEPKRNLEDEFYDRIDKRNFDKLIGTYNVKRVIVGKSSGTVRTADHGPEEVDYFYLPILQNAVFGDFNGVDCLDPRLCFTSFECIGTFCFVCTATGCHPGPAAGLYGVLDGRLRLDVYGPLSASIWPGATGISPRVCGSGRLPISWRWKPSKSGSRNGGDERHSRGRVGSIDFAVPTSPASDGHGRAVSRRRNPRSCGRSLSRWTGQPRHQPVCVYGSILQKRRPSRNGLRSPDERRLVQTASSR